MRKSILIVLALALIAGTASAKFGDLVASFRNPGYSSYSHYGLAADANYLYSFHYYSGWRYPVIRMRRSNGAFVSSYPCPLGTGSGQYYGRGMCYDGLGYIYIQNYSRRYVARFRASTGSRLSTWTWPSGSRYGISVDHGASTGGTYIYQSYYNGDFWKSRTTGSFISSWSMPYMTYSMDDDWDWNNKVIWVSNYNNDWIYGLNPNTHKILHSFRHPKWASISSTYGIAYWPPYLYVSNSSGSPDEYIWVFHCPNNVGAAPASLGKIKTLFE